MDHTKQLNRIEKMIETMANFMMGEFQKIEARFEEQEKKLDEKVDRKEFNKELNSLKLELLDKLAPRYRVENHEIRLKKLESKIKIT